LFKREGRGGDPTQRATHSKLIIIDISSQTSSVKIGETASEGICINKDEHIRNDSYGRGIREWIERKYDFEHESDAIK
jgi:hypothetical protein